MPIDVDNDANLGALAESRQGAARDYRDVVYVCVSHGVGAGLVLGGRLHHGRSGAAGEIGHSTIDENGPVCRCGNRGCLEMYVAAPSLLAMLEPTHGTLSMQGVLDRAATGDLGCVRVLEDSGRHLGVAVANLCNLVDPQVVVVGGQVADAGELLLEPLRAALARRSVPSDVGPVPVVRAAFGAQAELRGALLLALENVEIARGGAR